MLVRDVQFWNAPFPIKVILSGTTMLVRDVQPENALSLISVTVFGITRLVTSSLFIYRFFA